MYCVPRSSPRPSSLCGVVEAMEVRIWLASHEQRCPLVRQAYVTVLGLLRENCSKAFLMNIGSLLMKELHRTPRTLEVQLCLHFACRKIMNENFKWLYIASNKIIHHSKGIHFKILTSSTHDCQRCLSH